MQALKFLSKFISKMTMLAIGVKHHPLHIKAVKAAQLCVLSIKDVARNNVHMGS
jgi:uncharacterized membrane protein YadS